ncbi:MAG: hypothetical protein ACP5N2_02695 [Candidatus Nanoarchaeia archaeon]
MKNNDLYLKKTESKTTMRVEATINYLNNSSNHLLLMAAADLIMNDTLQITYAQGFPKELELNKEYSFEKDNLRLYRLPPVRVFLAHNKDGVWDYLGEAIITELNILPLKNKTTGKFKAVKLYSEEHRRVMNENMQPAIHNTHTS